MAFRIESDYKLSSEWLPDAIFNKVFENESEAVAIAIEGVDDPEIQEVRVIDIDTGEIVRRTTDLDYGDGDKY